MVLADGGIACIDDFEKQWMRGTALQSMRPLCTKILADGVTTMQNMCCSLLATTNPRFETFDAYDNPAELMDFETTIFSLFAIMFLVRDVCDADCDDIPVE
mmetsp:Transcript_54057/g.107602  ORF Transcript_54057/g.107602 Transcript_54057/m.107602 type:complete len:101 (-) Transcript_54057:83-385(-)